MHNDSIIICNILVYETRGKFYFREFFLNDRLNLSIVLRCCFFFSS